MKWASENGASVEGFEMVNFKEEGFGLRATRDIKVSLYTVGLGGVSNCVWTVLCRGHKMWRQMPWACSEPCGRGQGAANTATPAAAVP